MSRIIVSCLIVILYFAPAWAEQLSLKEAVETARKNNPDLAAARAKWEAAKVKVPQVLSLADPKLGLEYEQIPSGSRNPEDGMKMYTFEQMIMFPGKIYADYLMAAKEEEMYNARYKNKILEIGSAVKSAYY